MSDSLLARVCKVRVRHVNTRLSRYEASSDHDPVEVTLDCDA